MWFRWLLLSDIFSWLARIHVWSKTICSDFNETHIRMLTVFLWLKERVFSFQNNLKDLDLSYKTDLDLGDCLGRVKPIL